MVRHVHWYMDACLRAASACLRGACCGVIGCIVNDLNDLYYDLE